MTMPRLLRVPLVCALIASAAHAGAQGACTAEGASVPRSAAAQPRIIVIPFTKTGEDIRTVLENDFGRQIAVAKIKEAFDARQFPTIDFMGAVRAMNRGQGMAMESETDFRDRLLEANRADIYVIANFQPNTSSDGLTSVTLILEAYLTANGYSLGSKTGRSPRNRLSDTSAHIERVVGELAEPLLDVMQTRFCEFQDEGVPLSVEFRLASGAATTMQSEVAGKNATLSELLEEWFEANAYKGGYAVSLSTRNTLQLSDVRLPLRDANGRPGSASRFGNEIVRYLRSIGVTATPSVSSGAIYVDIQ